MQSLTGSPPLIIANVPLIITNVHPHDSVDSGYCLLRPTLTLLHLLQLLVQRRCRGSGEGRMAFAERMIFDTWPAATFSVFAKEGNLHVLRILWRLRWEVCRRIVEAELGSSSHDAGPSRAA